MSHHIAVIGAGPGGYAAAFYAADLGMQVTLIDNEKNPGGVCLYRGCIPSKALLHVAKLLEESKHAKEWGVDFGEAKVDINKLRDYKNRVVDYMILALGSLPTKIPSLSIDSPRVLDSTGALDLPEIPKSMLVIGGGYIGLELGSVYAALGTRVSVVEMTPGLLPGADRDLVRFLAQRVEKTFEKVMVSTKVTSMKASDKNVTVSFEGEGAPKEATYDYVLVSIGRRPNAKIDGLDKTKVKVDAKGFIETDGQRRTGESTIFAIGDVAGEPMLAHKASHEARVAVEAIQGHKAVFEPLAIPAVVFTDPEIAWTGLTEAQAQADGRDVEIAKFPWGALSRAITVDRPDGLTKLVLDKKTGRVLGVGIVGAGAGELIAEGVLAIEMGTNAEDLRMTIHPHPTLSETLMESAEVFFGQSTHVYRPKRK